MSNHWENLRTIKCFPEWGDYLEKHQHSLKVADEPDDMNAFHHFLSNVDREFNWTEPEDFGHARPYLNILLNPVDADERAARKKKWIIPGVNLDSTFYKAYVEEKSAPLVLYLAKEVLGMSDSELYALIVDLILSDDVFELVESDLALEEWIELGISPVGLFEAMCKKENRDHLMSMQVREELGQLIDSMFTIPDVVHFVLEHGDPKKKSCADFVNSAVNRLIPNKVFAHTRAFELRQKVLEMLGSEALQSHLGPFSIGMFGTEEPQSHFESEST